MESNLVILLPPYARERFLEDGVLARLEQHFDVVEIGYYASGTPAQAQAFLQELLALTPEVVVFPSESTLSKYNLCVPQIDAGWFFGKQNGSYVRDDPAGCLLGVDWIWQQLAQHAIAVQEVAMSVAGPFDDELTIPPFVLDDFLAGMAGKNTSPTRKS